MSSSKNSRKAQVQELLLRGYTQAKIALELNVCDRTIRRDIQKLKERSRFWLENLAREEFIFEYQQTLAGLKQDMSRLNEMYEDESVQKNIPLQLKILKQISETRSKYGELLHKGPMIMSIGKLLNISNQNTLKTNT